MPRTVLTFFIYLITTSYLDCSFGYTADKPNILLILVDDLKPTLGGYGDTFVKSSNIDRLASRGMRFELAYCNQAVCAPTRLTLMPSSHSTSTGRYGLNSNLRKTLPRAVTLPLHFAAHGYRTESPGKVFHIGRGNEGDLASFSVPHFQDKVIEYLDPTSTDGGHLTREEALFANQSLDKIRSLPRGAAFESPQVSDESYADGRVAAETIKRLQVAKRRDDSDTPFFIAAGFVRPHLPLSAPKKYWDWYDPEKIPVPGFEKPPAGAPKVAGKVGGEIVASRPVPEDKNAVYPTELKRQLIHGYYARTSIMDVQVGKVIEELDRLQLTANTIVVFWSDHGFHLGDDGIWTKHTNYEQATRIPMLICAPGTTKPMTTPRQLVESVDIYPTLTELAGLPVHRGPQSIDGESLMSVLRDSNIRVRGHSFHAYPNQKPGRAI